MCWPSTCGPEFYTVVRSSVGMCLNCCMSLRAVQWCVTVGKQLGFTVLLNIKTSEDNKVCKWQLSPDEGDFDIGTSHLQFDDIYYKSVFNVISFSLSCYWGGSGKGSI